MYSSMFFYLCLQYSCVLSDCPDACVSQVKSFAKPPPLVQTTMEAVCVLLGRKADWDSSKKLLGESDFMEQLLSFDKDNIDPKRLKLLTKYTAMEDFTPDRYVRHAHTHAYTHTQASARAN